MSRLKEINDEIYRRWKAGENHVDLAEEYGRYGLQTMLLRRQLAEERVGQPPGPNSWALHKQNRKRDEDIILGRAAGATYQSLADKYGVCKERVRQIWMKHLRKCGDPRGYGMKG